jgi:hypothetical protein
MNGRPLRDPDSALPNDHFWVFTSDGRLPPGSISISI